jgi:tetratricopeptide (TPR) repeat protein
MGGVFISYRREESEGYAGRLYDILIERLGAEQCFMDVEGIGPGVDFARIITEHLSRCDSMLVVIGPRWLTVQNEAGQPRILDTADWVRTEVSIGLKKDDLLLVPVLVGGGVLPKSSQLTPELQALSDRNAFELHQTNFRKRAFELADKLKEESRQRTKIRTEKANKEALDKFERAEKVLKPFQYPVWTLFVAAAILLSAAWTIDVAPSVIEAHGLVKRADAARVAGDYRNALSLYSNALNTDRQSRVALLGLALTRFTIGDTASREEAFALLTRVRLSKDDWKNLLPLLKEEDLRRIVARRYPELSETSINNSIEQK